MLRCGGLLPKALKMQGMENEGDGRRLLVTQVGTRLVVCEMFVRGDRTRRLGVGQYCNSLSSSIVQGVSEV